MATRTIDTEITLKGEREFNQQMKAVNSNLKTLRSDMALVTSEFTGNANSVDALRAKQEVLQRQYDQQREKVRALTAMMEDARKTLGEDSAEYDKYRTQVNNATVQLNTFGRDLEQTNQYLGEAQKSADGTAKSIDEYGKAAKKGGEQSDKMGDEVKSAGDKSEAAAKNLKRPETLQRRWVKWQQQQLPLLPPPQPSLVKRPSTLMQSMSSWSAASRPCLERMPHIKS